MRRPLVAGNWKMNGTCSSVAALSQQLHEMKLGGEVDVAVLPGALHIGQAREGLKGSSISLGAQDCSVEPDFYARTGEVCAAQLADIGCVWVLVGHSERRLMLGEGNELVARKFLAAQSKGLIPILCVGETLAQREAGDFWSIIRGQVEAVVELAGVPAFAGAVVAYEPVWAIGTGKTASPDEAQAVHAAIRGWIAERSESVAAGLRIVYGGSVKASNAAELFAKPDIDGGLVGGASLNAEEFGAICRAARI